MITVLAAFGAEGAGKSFCFKGLGEDRACVRVLPVAILAPDYVGLLPARNYLEIDSPPDELIDEASVVALVNKHF